MAVTRRDLLLFGAGTVAALPFTPVPWKLLDDVSIWTQNFPWLPVPRAGHLTLAPAACTLCLSGCGMKVRCVNGRPIGVTPVADHPVSRGALCPLAFGAHQLAWHPRRLRECRLRGEKAGPARIAAAVAGALAAGKRLAILDERPGRAVSTLYRQAAARAQGLYLAAQAAEEAPLEALRALAGGGAPELGFDLARAAAVLSFGAPLLDGWGVPGEVIARSRSGEARFIHAGPRFSHTARLADEWLPILPGSEAALALALARVLVDEGLAAPAAGLDHFRSLLDGMPLSRAAQITGLSAERIVGTARALRAGGPAAAIGGGDVAAPLDRETEAAVAALNILLGAAGREGCIVARRPLAEDVPDMAPVSRLEEAGLGSIGVLLIEAATAGPARPWRAIASRLEPGALVVALSAYGSGYAEHAGALVATPAFLESAAEAPTAPGAARHSFALAPALLQAPGTAIEPAGFIALLAAEAGWEGLAAATTDSVLRTRAAAIHAARRGSVFTLADGTTAPAGEFASAAGLHARLAGGAVWVDDAPAAAALKPVLPGATADERTKLLAAATKPLADAAPEFALVAIPAVWAGAAPAGVRVPLAGKLDQESRLRALPGEVALHPASARKSGVSGGARVRLESPGAGCSALVRIDDAVMPGVAELTPGSPDALDLFASEHGAAARAVRVRLGRA